MGIRRGVRVAALVEYVVSCGRVGASRTEIGKAIGLARSPHLTELLRECVEQGVLREFADLRFTPARYLYFAPVFAPDGDTIDADAVVDWERLRDMANGNHDGYDIGASMRWSPAGASGK